MLRSLVQGPQFEKQEDGTIDQRNEKNMHKLYDLEIILGFLVHLIVKITDCVGKK